MKMNKNLEFSIKLMVLIALIAFLIFDFYLQVNNPTKNLLGIPLLERLSIYYAFFTTQSNYAVVIFLVISLFMKKIYNTKPPFGIELATTIYVTITMIVFWLGILAPGFEMNDYSMSNWMATVVLHLFIPCIMIGNFFFSCGDNYYSVRKCLKFAFPLTCMYPLGYFIFVMIRGEVRFNTFSPEFFNYIYSNGSEEFWEFVWTPQMGIIDRSVYFTSRMWYPYWFLNINNYSLVANGVVIESNMDWSYSARTAMLVLAFILIFSLVAFFYFFYLKWNNNKYYRWHDINSNLITREEHDYRIKKRKLEKAKIKNELRMEKVHKKAEFRIFKKTIKNLSGDDKRIEVNKWFESKKLEKKLRHARIKQERTKVRTNRILIRKLIASVKYGDKIIIKENLREAERFKKLVKKGVFISKTKYVD